jgi:hypothetical protein
LQSEEKKFDLLFLYFISSLIKENKHQRIDTNKKKHWQVNNAKENKIEEPNREREKQHKKGKQDKVYPKNTSLRPSGGV